ncbi:uncharacterized protein RHOBADRAFT_54539 [Rhodotorula graminis WP1]|uniref:Uncharacterized protein n=1 Tax=Rhodotorula graminis (strain WP1) TaxID=578459 RepID=A0A0P9EX29_RHOGW|nr:uncharacterized protein RHOBADRAFT_54539 [Rhodotorula graminis WP1]KPV73956.1 hypothetical protein RHOBADRAFT_54539 [Rhodotorula graminis WP1]
MPEQDIQLTWVTYFSGGKGIRIGVLPMTPSVFAFFTLCNYTETTMGPTHELREGEVYLFRVSKPEALVKIMGDKSKAYRLWKACVNVMHLSSFSRGLYTNMENLFPCEDLAAELDHEGILTPEQLAQLRAVIEKAKTSQPVDQKEELKAVTNLDAGQRRELEQLLDRQAGGPFDFSGAAKKRDGLQGIEDLDKNDHQLTTEQVIATIEAGYARVDDTVVKEKMAVTIKGMFNDATEYRAANLAFQQQQKQQQQALDGSSAAHGDDNAMQVDETLPDPGNSAKRAREIAEASASKQTSVSKKQKNDVAASTGDRQRGGGFGTPSAVEQGVNGKGGSASSSRVAGKKSSSSSSSKVKGQGKGGATNASCGTLASFFGVTNAVASTSRSSNGRPTSVGSNERAPRRGTSRPTSHGKKAFVVDTDDETNDSNKESFVDDDEEEEAQSTE